VLRPLNVACGVAYVEHSSAAPANQAPVCWLASSAVLPEVFLCGCPATLVGPVCWAGSGEVARRHRSSGCVLVEAGLVA
jgi:hypothetical protein